MHDYSELRLLIVEDQPESSALLRGILNELGITQVSEASDGQAALELMDSAFDSIDLILCDWNMPSMSGIEFLRQVRGAGVTTPFMMITGRGDQDSVVEAKKFGVDGYIRKPYSSIQVEAKIRIMAQRIKVA